MVRALTNRKPQGRKLLPCFNASIFSNTVAVVRVLTNRKSQERKLLPCFKASMFSYTIAVVRVLTNHMNKSEIKGYYFNP